MNKWNLKSACIINESLFNNFKLAYSDCVLDFTDLVTTINYLSSLIKKQLFYVITTPSKNYLFINCECSNFKTYKDKILSIIENKVHLLTLKNRIRNDFKNN